MQGPLSVSSTSGGAGLDTQKCLFTTSIVTIDWIGTGRLLTVFRPWLPVRWTSAGGDTPPAGRVFARDNHAIANSASTGRIRPFITRGESNFDV